MLEKGLHHQNPYSLRMVLETSSILSGAGAVWDCCQDLNYDNHLVFPLSFGRWDRLWLVDGSAIQQKPLQRRSCTFHYFWVARWSRETSLEQIRRYDWNVSTVLTLPRIEVEHVWKELQSLGGTQFPLKHDCWRESWWKFKRIPRKVLVGDIIHTSRVVLWFGQMISQWPIGSLGWWFGYLGSWKGWWMVT